MDKTSTIYKKVKKEADEKFKAPTSVYKSSWIVREYKERGGLFKDKEPSNKHGLKRWFKEEWVRVNKDGKIMKKNNTPVPCGRSDEEQDKNVKKGLCRPSKRIGKNTPKTIEELGPKILKNRYKRKKKTPDEIII